MKRKSFRLIFILGAVFLCIGLISPLAATGNNGAVGMIGGADTPTYGFLLFNLYGGLLFFLVLLGANLMITAAFCRIFAGTVKAHCSAATTGICLGLSAVGALGLICAFVWFTIVSFHESSKYPVAFPVSIILGILCLFAFFALIAAYFMARSGKWSVKGFLIDVLTSILCLPTFFFAFMCLYSLF